MKNILFITWDGPQTSYMEGLFMPIFNEIQLQFNYKFHIIQFTWATKEKNDLVLKMANEYKIQYISQPVYRKPIATIGSIYSIIKGIKFIKKYISNNQIDIVMPRSTMPSIMINRIKKVNFKLLFDADGLPIEERVDFSNLSKSSLQYKFFKKEENKILKKSDGVLTRSKKAITIHKETLNLKNDEKFLVVINGRNSDFFKFDINERERIRKKLKIEKDTKVFIYCGSLGKQYGWKLMIKIFKGYYLKNPNSKFLILTGNVEYAKTRISKDILDAIIVVKIPFEEVPNYLSIGDVAFAIREPKYSMQGVAPIKLGEYLLMGLPTIASIGIGDSEEIISKIPNCFLFNHQEPLNIEHTINYIENLITINREAIRQFGIENFSIEKSAKSYITAIEKLK